MTIRAAELFMQTVYKREVDLGWGLYRPLVHKHMEQIKKDSNMSYGATVRRLEKSITKVTKQTINIERASFLGDSCFQ